MTTSCCEMVIIGEARLLGEFRDTLRAFCEEKVAPHAAEVDRNAEFPWKSFEACKEMELPALGIPEEYGGAGADSGSGAEPVGAVSTSRLCVLSVSTSRGSIS